MVILLQLETQLLQMTLNLLSTGAVTNAPPEDILDNQRFICSLFEESEVDPIFTSMNCGTPVTGVNPFTGNEDFNNLEPGDLYF